MDLIDVLHQTVEDTMGAYGLSDMAVGTVTSTEPLEVTIRESMAPLPQEALRLTSAVIEKKIPALAHKHDTIGFRHNHAIPGLSHTHDAPDGATGTALEGEYATGDALTPDAYTSDEQLTDIVCYEDGKPLPEEDGFILLNRRLAVGDRVLLLRVMRGEQFIILSRVFERGDDDGNIAAGGD